MALRLTILLISLTLCGCGDAGGERLKNLKKERISCLGQIVPGERIIHVGAPANSIIDKIFVKRGDWVKAGSVLATLRELKVHEAKVAHAKQNIKAAKIDLEKIRKGKRKEIIEAQTSLIEAQQKEVEWLRKCSSRFLTLIKSDSTSKAELEKAEADFAIAKARLKRQKSILEGFKSGRKEEIEKAEVQLKLAEAKLKEEKESLELQYIKAPSNGEILDVLVFPGEALKDNGTVVYMGNTRNMMVLAEVYETSIMHVKLGSPAKIYSKAFGKEFQGKVVEIQHYLESDRIFKFDPSVHVDNRVVLVRISPDKPDILAPYCNAQVSVTISNP